MILPALILVTGLIACGGGSGGDGGGGMMPRTISASFNPSASGEAADRVRIVRSAASGDLLTLDVVIGGPSTGTDLFGFAFDIVLADAGMVEYVQGSVTLGSALTDSGCAGMQALASQSGNRVVVGVTKLGNCPGNAIAAG